MDRLVINTVGPSVKNVIKGSLIHSFWCYISKRFFLGTSIADTVHTVYSVMLSFPSRLHYTVLYPHCKFTLRNWGRGGDFCFCITELRMHFPGRKGKRRTK